MILPGTTSHNYKSSFFSEFHPWLCEMGYPRLDVNVYEEDGSWEIIELQNGGLIPSEAKYLTVLMDIRNLEPNYSTIQRLIHSLDIYRGEYLDYELAKSKAVEDEWHDVQRRRNDLIAQTNKIVSQNEGLKERIARRGASALDLVNIARYVPRSRL